MISQPELGNKIFEIRKGKGLTQEELVEKCNLSVRTLQRIESGEVTPRNSTIRMIFDALEINPTNYFENNVKKEKSQKWHNKLFIWCNGLFNLKTSTIKKITILILLLAAIIIAIYFLKNALITQDNTLPQMQRSTGTR